MNFSTNTTDSSMVTEPSIISRIIGIAVPLISFLINAGFVAVGIQSLKKTFHNLLVLLLCFNDGVNGLWIAIFAIARKIEQFKDNTILCGVFFTAIFYGFLTSYVIIFLLGFVRLVTIRYKNYNFIHKLERYKYRIFFIAHLASLLLVVIVSVSLHAAPRFQSCTPVTLYGKYYRIFILAEWVPISVLILAVIMMYILTSYHIWKLFFQRNTVYPNSLSTNVELKAKHHQNSNEIVTNRSLRSRESTDVGKAFVLEASTQRLDNKAERFGQPWIISSECTSPVIEIDRDEKQEETDREEVNIDEIELNDEKAVETNKDDENPEKTGRNDENPDETYRDDENPEETDRGEETHERTIKSVTTEMMISNPNDNRISKTTNTNKDDIWQVRAFKTSLLVASTTVFLTAPFAVTFLYDLFAQDFMAMQTRGIVYTFCGINTILDPFIYAFRVPEIRENIRKKLSRQ